MAASTGRGAAKSDAKRAGQVILTVTVRAVTVHDTLNPANNPQINTLLNQLHSCPKEF